MKAARYAWLKQQQQQHQLHSGEEQQKRRRSKQGLTALTSVLSTDGEEKNSNDADRKNRSMLLHLAVSGSHPGDSSLRQETSALKKEATVSFVHKLLLPLIF